MARPVAISIGCPCGIGPEVAIRAAATADSSCLLVGDVDLLSRAATAHGLAGRLVRVESAGAASRLEPGRIGVWGPSHRLTRHARPGAPTVADGAAQLAWIDEATDLTSRGVTSALVTGPVSKAAIARSGGPVARRFRGHTEHIADRLAASVSVMAFWSPKLSTSLVTTHLPLARVPRAVTPERVAASTFWLARLLGRLGTRRPRIVVAGLNPHAGEEGHLGMEEARAVGPGIDLARERLGREGPPAILSGPIGAESAYRLALAGGFDGVVAMYHDQATIPMKLVGFGDAVNVTLGLPIVRTSVDHGTAYDLAGTGRADPSGMAAAIALAARLARARPKRALPSAKMTKRSREPKEIR